MKNPVVRKILVLCTVVLVLMVGLWRVESLVQERGQTRQRATEGVMQSFSGPQALLGPLLHVACVEVWQEAQTKDEKTTSVERRSEHVHTLAPSSLSVSGTASPEMLRRGLFAVPTYVLDARLQARWDDLEPLRPPLHQRGARQECGAPVLMLAVSDARGVRRARLLLDGQERALKAGTFHPIYKQGVHTLLPDAVRHRGGALALELQLELAGTEQLALVPLGEQTDLHIRSPWPHPSFGGDFLPSQRQVSEDGFEARWRLSSLASTATQDVAAQKPLCAFAWGESASAATAEEPDASRPTGHCVQSVRLRLIDPINPYSLADRATKYGLLFVLLTFVAVGLVELLQGRPVHPVQYLLVGSALSAFFLLLLSLSEHLPFAWAYLGASAACVLLLAYYGAHMLGRWSRGATLGAGIALLYGVLFVLLRLEQTALLVGSAALFVVLAAVMVLTRKVDWYGLGQAPQA